MPPQALAAVATVLAFLPHGNRIELQLDRGSAELTWITPSTFHFRRVLNGPLHPSEEAAHEPVPLTTDDTGGQLRMRSRVVEVTIEKQGLKVAVRRPDGTPLMVDVSEARSEAGGVVWERQAIPGASFYGLGPRTDAGFDLRGKSIRAEVPFLVSPAAMASTIPARALTISTSRKKRATAYRGQRSITTSITVRRRRKYLKSTICMGTTPTRGAFRATTLEVGPH